ncbi:hypothetical protein K353_01832 [Kitasatospora sp. SolWspMP-SS2h]|uniref:hypothetical protein n=1 Tax=Kitasatospora sp. SolWspMP-SS2h TaxID=1305729 RepID=UPI000DB91B2D|nr:hypothetical protein [Kitasatospora sp. SolWspMP-SS2h]RAJ43576.1 hypothetical protein K353_01832 [Kitasatospora sp. SolWspMP-SS2h]
MDESTAAVPTKAPHPRRAAAALFGAALAAGLLTACGGSGSPAATAPVSATATASSSASPSASSDPGSASASAPASPSASASPQPSAAQPTTPGIAVGERPPTAVKIPATGYRQDGPTQLTVFFTAGICDRYGVRVEEAAPPVVKLRVVVTQTAEPGKACPQLVKEQQATVTLPGPMTGGGVVDTATGEQVPVQSGVAGGDPR